MIREALCGLSRLNIPRLCQNQNDNHLPACSLILHGCLSEKVTQGILEGIREANLPI